MATPFPFTSGQTLLASQLNAITTLPTSTKTASHTLVIADQGTRVIMNSATATTITVNNSIFGAQDVVEIQNIGAGVCTVTAGSCTVSSAGPLAIPQHGGGQLVFSSASAATFFPTAVTVSASGVVQVKSAAKTDTFSTTSSTFVDVTGLSISITPTSASNKILVLADIKLNGQAGTNTAYARLVRASTAIYLGDAAGTRTPASSASRVASEGVASSGNIFLDSPATTTATTYKVQIAVNAAAAGTIFVNQGSDDGDGSTRGRYASSITVMEVTP